MKRIYLIFFVVLGLIGSSLYGQERRVTGTVTQFSDGGTLPGVTVRVQGTTLGTTTDMDGRYEITVPSDAILVFTYIGMNTEEIAVNDRQIIDVAMVSDVSMLQEIVVTALGMSRERKALGYNIQEVSSEDLLRANTDDVVKALSAKTSGVSIVSASGSAGAAAHITIRGSASLTGNNQPLFIVDGQPISSTGSGDGGNSVDGVQRSNRSIDINPEDIENITVLKGGAATALYGIQAANGVVMITTKKGKRNQPLQVNLTSSVAMSEVSQLPPMQDQFAQGSGGTWISGNLGSWGPRMDQSAYTKDPAAWVRPDMNTFGAIVPSNSPFADASLGAVTPADRYEFFQNGLTFNNNVSVSKGTDVSQFFLSVGNRREEAVVPNELFQRTSIRANASSFLLPNLKVEANSNYVNSQGNFIQKGSNISGVMLGLLRTPASFFNEEGYKLPDGSQRTYRHGGGYDNPYWTVNENFYDESVNRFIGNSAIEWNALDWLTFKYQIGADWYVRRYKDVLAIGSRALPNGGVTDGSNFTSLINSDLLAMINRDLTDDINLSATVGYNLYGSFSKTVQGGTNAPLEIPEYYNLSNTSQQNASAGESEFRSQAGFADVNVAFRNMLYIGGTGRYESATSMPNSQGKFYPSGNISFVFSELPGLQGNSVLSYGKLRASYSIVANVAPIYALSTSWFSGGVGDGWTAGGGFPMLGSTGFTLGNTGGSPTLVHEQMKSFETGIELAFFNNRLGFDFTYFNNYNSDLILSVPIAASTGFTGQIMNAAEMSSEGIEISFNATPVLTTDFQWKINANFTQLNNIVQKLAPGIENLFLGGFVDPQIRAVAGEAYRSIYGFDWHRDANGNVLINTDPNQGRVGYPLTNEDQGMISLGKVDPDWTANLLNEFSYKGISLSTLFDFRMGGLMYNGTQYAMNFFGTSKLTENREVVYNADGTIDFSATPAENIMVFDGVMGYLDADGNVVTDGLENNIPVVADQAWFLGYGSNFGGGPTAAAMEDVSWIRMREISLSYRFNPSLLANLNLSSLEVFFTGYNLLLITPYTGVDPETSLLGSTNALGMDYFNMPGRKTYTFGLRVGI